MLGPVEDDDQITRQPTNNNEDNNDMEGEEEEMGASNKGAPDAAVPSREVCRCTGQSHPQLAVCTSTSHFIQQC